VTRPRIYVSGPLEVGTDLALGQEPSEHLARVLRARPGDALSLFDGHGAEYEARVVAVGRRSIAARVLGRCSVDRESPLCLHLLQGVSRGERMDYTIQKAVELGVSRITPVLSRRSVVQLDADRAARKLDHWHSVVISACEQCGRNQIPALDPPQPWPAALKLAQAELRLCLAPDAAAGVRSLSERAEEVALLAGPEGGLAPEELAEAVAQGWCALRLGPRVLRTETAAVAALAALQVLRGDLG